MQTDNYQTNDLSGLIANYSELVDQVFRFIYMKTSSKEIAEDLTSECFLGAMQYLKNKEIRNMRAFLFRAARNRVIDYYRRKDRIIYSDEIVLANAPATRRDDMAIAFDAQTVIKQLSALKEQDKDILTMRYVEDMDISEIAKAMGKSQVAIRVQIFRALRKFKKIINK